jgi:hypothetical protein
MKNILFSMLFLALFSCRESNKADNQDHQKENETSSWTHLLENDLSKHWQMYNQDSIKGWKLIDGQLYSSGAGWDKNEDLITKKEYGDFELSLEWKIEAENSSGIFFHVQKDSLKPIYESAPEYQLLDDEGWPQEMKPNQYTAASYAMYAPEGGTLKPVGEWNTTRIVVKHPQIEHWLNGVKVVHYEIGSADWKERKALDKWANVPQYGKAKAGYIGLQNAGKVVFREIKIKEF